MKVYYTTDDGKHTFDSKEECEKFEKNRTPEHKKELEEKINAAHKELENLIEEYKKLFCNIDLTHSQTIISADISDLIDMFGWL